MHDMGVLGARLGQVADDVVGVTRTLMTPRGVIGAATEFAWQATHLAIYPWGLLRDRLIIDEARLRLDDLPPIRRSLAVGDVEAASTPIVLLHGVGDNRSIFALLRRGLRRRGFDRVLGYNYSPFSSDIRDVAAELADVIEKLCEETGFERIHVIGHSMGGLVARYYVQRLGGDARVHTLVTLGTPHSGTQVARLVPHPLARQLRPDSDLQSELAEPAECRTRFLAVWSDLDQVVIPQRSARVDHPDLGARNVLVRGVGHQSLPVHGRVIHEICTALAHLDHEGTQTSAGVTSLTAERGRRPGRSGAAKNTTAAPARRARRN